MYILNSIYVINEYNVIWGVCFDRSYAVISRPIVCSDLIPSWELASLLPCANYLLLCVRKHWVNETLQFGLYVGE